MKSTNELVKELRRRGEITVGENQRDILPDLMFTLDCMCITYKKREIETPKLGRVVRLKMTDSH